MVYIGVVTHLITNHLLTSWDIQVDGFLRPQDVRNMKWDPGPPREIDADFEGFPAIIITHSIHVWYIYLHSVDFYGIW